FHRMRRGDTLAAIARRYGTTVAQLRSWYKVGAKPKVGTVLKVRQASTQTVLPTENGDRRVVRRNDRPKRLPAVRPRKPAAGKAAPDTAAKHPVTARPPKPAAAKSSKSRPKAAARKSPPGAAKAVPATSKRVNKRT